jgi:hypothetical protein
MTKGDDLSSAWEKDFSRSLEMTKREIVKRQEQENLK